MADLPPPPLLTFNGGNDGGGSTASSGGDGVRGIVYSGRGSGLLSDDAITNVVYGVGPGPAQMKAICVGIGNDTIRMDVSGATTYI